MNRLLAILIVCSGCSRTAVPQPEPTAVAPTVAPIVATESPQKAVSPVVDKFDTALAAFVEEANVVLRSMKLLPPAEEFAGKVAALKDVYARIPDAPKDNPAKINQAKAARQITVNLNIGIEYLKLYADALDLKSKELAQRSVDKFKNLGAELKADLDELEAAAKEGRETTVKLSDVIKNE